jgi:hypothetical protein
VPGLLNGCGQESVNTGPGGPLKKQSHKVTNLIAGSCCGQKQLPASWARIAGGQAVLYCFIVTRIYIYIAIFENAFKFSIFKKDAFGP